MGNSQSETSCMAAAAGVARKLSAGRTSSIVSTDKSVRSEANPMPTLVADDTVGIADCGTKSAGGPESSMPTAFDEKTSTVDREVTIDTQGEVQTTTEVAAKVQEDKGKGKGKGKPNKPQSPGSEKAGKGKGKAGRGKSAYAQPNYFTDFGLLWPGPVYDGPHVNGGYRLNVKNLAPEIEEKDLKQAFAPYGKVIAAQVKTKKDGKSRGFGYVILRTEEEGQKAIDSLDGKEVNDRTWTVQPAQRASDQYPGTDSAKGKGKGKSQYKGKGKHGAGSDQLMAAQQATIQNYMQSMQMMQQQAYMSMYGHTSGDLPPPPPASFDPTAEYEGSLKSISSRNGFGFIVCAATSQIFGRDVYIDRESIPEGVKVRDRVKFTVELNDKNHPRARNVKMAIDCTSVPEP